jgi:hypothetical protein
MLAMTHPVIKIVTRHEGLKAVCPSRLFQHITFPYVVLNISDGDFAPGITYVGISRVKSLTVVRGESDWYCESEEG